MEFPGFFSSEKWFGTDFRGFVASEKWFGTEVRSFSLTRNRRNSDRTVVCSVLFRITRNNFLSENGNPNHRQIRCVFRHGFCLTRASGLTAYAFPVQSPLVHCLPRVGLQNSLAPINFSFLAGLLTTAFGGFMYCASLSTMSCGPHTWVG